MTALLILIKNKRNFHLTLYTHMHARTPHIHTHTHTHTHQYRFNRLTGTFSTHRVHQLFLTNRDSVESLFYRLIRSSIILSHRQGFPDLWGRVQTKYILVDMYSFGEGI